MNEAALIPPREIDAVGDRQPGLALADRVAHERRGGGGCVSAATCGVTMIRG